MPPTAPAERKARGQELLREVRPKVAELTVRVNKPDAEVLVDGKAVGRSPLADAVFVEPGDHALEAKLGGAAAKASVSAKGGGAQEVTLAFEEAKGPPPAQKSAVPLILLGAGAVVAGATGGAVLGAWSEKRSAVQRTSESIRNSGSSCVTGAANFDTQCSTLEADARTAETLNRAGIALLAGASALALGAGVYWLLWPAPTGRHSARLIPVASPQGGGGLLMGSF